MKFVEGGDSRLQAYLTRCINQRIVYERDKIPKRIEEALEECVYISYHLSYLITSRLNIVPIKIDRKAPIPECTMRVVPESEESKHSYGPSDKKEVGNAEVGQQLRIEWSLVPESGTLLGIKSV